MQEFSFTVGEEKLKGALFYPPNPKAKNPAILFIHGWTGKMKSSFQYAEALSKLGFVCMLFDMRGHGTSEGGINAFTIEEFLDDVIAGYDYLLNVEGVDKENVSAVGASFGGYLVAVLSSKRTIRNLVLRVPANYPNSSFEKIKYISTGKESPNLIEWRKKEISYSETFSLDAIHKFNGEVLVVESEFDDMVDHQTIMNYINALEDKSKVKHVLIKGAPHSIKEGKFRDETTKILVEWFNTKV